MYHLFMKFWDPQPLIPLTPLTPAESAPEISLIIEIREAHVTVSLKQFRSFAGVSTVLMH